MKTKTIATKEAVPGMIVAEDIFGLQDYLIIPAHSELTNHSITRLKFYAIQQIEIETNEDGESKKQSMMLHRIPILSISKVHWNFENLTKHTILLFLT